jgi:RNA polymerase-binding transcription factor DksA
MFNDEQRRTAERRLLKERDLALEAIGQHDAQSQDLRERAGELSVYRLHPADVGSEAHEQEKDFLLASVEGRRLYAIDEALTRLYRTPDDFGQCTVCGRDIEMDRIDVIPETTLCAAHARQQEERSGTAGDADPREAWRDPER